MHAYVFPRKPAERYLIGLVALAHAGTIQSHMLHAQLLLIRYEDVKGLDARCVSNIIWAVIKLELAVEPSSLGSQLILNASPLVIKFLPQSSSQVLRWAGSKFPSLR